MAASDTADKNTAAGADSARIGWAFLSQYYSYLNKDPARLHCFYTKRSTLIHSTEGEDATPCYGQQEIHAKIMSLQLDDCKVYISNVDSQGSAQGGIIVQVIGEMSNANGPWRKFAQTFFLAEQPHGYFVLNDICRYIKEEGVEDEALASAPAAAAAQSSSNEPQQQQEQQHNANTTDGEPASVQSVLFNEASSPPPAAPAAAQPHQAAPAQQQEQQEPEREQPTPASGSADSFTFHANGIAADEPASAPTAAKEVVEEPTPAEAAPEVPAPPSTVEEPAQPQPESKQQQQAAAAQEEPQPISAVEEKGTASPAAAEEPKKQEPEALAAPAKASEAAPAAAPVSAPTPKSWASLAASNVVKWGPNASQSKGTSAAAPAPAAESRPAASAASSSAPTAASASASASASAGQGGPAGGASAESPGFVEAVLAVRQPQCFVKGVLETVSDRLLRDTLTTRFGPLKEVDIVRNKACAFIEFEKLDHARRAIQASLRPSEGGDGGILVPLDDGTSTQRINVVERKPHDQRPTSGRGGARGGAHAHAGGEGRGGYKGAGGQGGGEG
ncbi:hypothetical protein DMC30DRAFT_370312, partial [Rhodotorula diobovata]